MGLREINDLTNTFRCSQQTRNTKDNQEERPQNKTLQQKLQMESRNQEQICSKQQDQRLKWMHLNLSLLPPKAHTQHSRFFPFLTSSYRMLSNFIFQENQDLKLASKRGDQVMCKTCAPKISVEISTQAHLNNKNVLVQ